MSEWPRIQTDVDDDRPATDDEVEFCLKCGKMELEGTFLRTIGELRCDACSPLCRECQNEQVDEVGQFCATCAMAALGVEV